MLALQEFRIFQRLEEISREHLYHPLTTPSAPSRRPKADLTPMRADETEVGGSEAPLCRMNGPSFFRNLDPLRPQVELFLCVFYHSFLSLYQVQVIAQYVRSYHSPFRTRCKSNILEFDPQMGLSSSSPRATSLTSLKNARG